jgi:hypothetical protein
MRQMPVPQLEAAKEEEGLSQNILPTIGYVGTAQTYGHNDR